MEYKLQNIHYLTNRLDVGRSQNQSQIKYKKKSV